MTDTTNREAGDTKAMIAPDTPVTIIDDPTVEAVIARSRHSSRRRMVLPLHKSPEAAVHRMLNALQSDSYIPPHRHLQPPKSETILVLRGRLLTLVFDDLGRITQTHVLTAGSSPLGIDIEPGVFHTFIALADDTVMLEVKPGPYAERTDKDFAPWAPAENTSGAAEYLDSLKEQAQILLRGEGR